MEDPARAMGDARAHPELGLIYSLGLLSCMYMFYLVTDYRLLPAIRVLCERLHIPDDVAGATLLGAALNAPELFTSAVSAFATNGSVGVGIVMGSFNFNIFLITGATALVARRKLRSRQLRVEWLFLQRDVYFYSIAVAMIALFCKDGLLEWWESLAMVLTYALYVLVCLASGRITRFCCPAKEYKPRRRRSALVRVATQGQFDITLYPRDLEKARTFSRRDLSNEAVVAELKKERSYRFQLESLRVQERAPHELILSRSQQISADLSGRSRESLDPMVAEGPGPLRLGSAPVDTNPLLEASPYSRLTRAFSNPIAVGKLDFGHRLTKEEERQFIHIATHPEAPDKINVDMRLVNCAHDEMSKDEPWATDVLEIAENIELEEEAEAYHSQHLLAWPKYRTIWEKALYVVNFPLYVIITYTIPSGEALYPVSITISILWLAVVSYCLSILSGRFGDALHIQDSVVGLTIDSIGTSLPNMLAAVVAGKSGRSETAICQAFGSNTFDALVAFGLVHLVKSVCTDFRPIQLSAQGVARDSIIDLVLVAMYIWFFYFFRFRLTRSFGCACIFTYLAWLGYQLYNVYK